MGVGVMRDGCRCYEKDMRREVVSVRCATLRLFLLLENFYLFYFVYYE